MRSAALTLALLVVFAGFAPVAAGMPSPDAEGVTETGVAPGQPAVSSPPPAALNPQTDIFVQLERDSDARWEVTIRYTLASDNETEAFRRLGRAFENGSAVGPDVAIFEEAARRSEAAADREMRVENISRDYAIENGTGTLSLSFTWTSFAKRTDSGSLKLDDVFRAPGNETWLTSLEANQELRIRTPPGYTIRRSPGFPYREDTIVVTSASLRSNPRPVIEYGQVRQTSTDTPREPNPLDMGAIGGVALAAVIVMLLIGWRRQQSRGAEVDAGRSGAESAGVGERPADGAAAGPELERDEIADPVASEAGASIGPEPAPVAEPDRAEADEESDEVDLSLLSDEERVEHLLERNGGRMKQAHIVRETGWSDAKVSQLLSAMAEDGRVDKLRLGRENLISLPEDDGD